tara:strand:+ start:504 stop:1118 length:615 start_codon:yes stop_codon:yes gene_type:complete
MIFVLGGQKRGNTVTWNSIAELQRLTEAKIYVSGYEHWGVLPFEYTWFDTPTEIVYNIFNDANSWYKNEDKYPRYYLQWRHLAHCYNSITPTSNEIIYKIRNDYNYSRFPLQDIEPNTIHVPEKEHHASRLFWPDVICNDQILGMDKPTADKYFDLPNYIPETPDKMLNIPKGRMKLSDIGIEAVLRDYMYHHNINLKTFFFRY